MTDFRTRTGRDLLQDVIDGRLDPPPMAKTLDFTLTSAAEGKATFHGTPGENALNPMGAVHGGWYGAVLDSALGCAVQSRLAAGEIYTTLEYKVNITRALPVGRAVVVEGVVQHKGRTTAVAVAEMRGVEDGKLYATGSATCLLITR